MVRVLYALPTDRDFRGDASEALRAAIKEVQMFFREELGGATFSIYSPTPELCLMSEPAAWYSTGDSWNKTREGIAHCGLSTMQDGQQASRFTWIVFADVDEACGDPFELGRGMEGLTILHRGDIEGLTFGTDDYYVCGRGPFAGGHGRWVGGLAHELAHAFGLKHPPGCDEGLPTCDEDALMWTGYSLYPNTHFRKDDKAFLLQSPFIGK